VLIALDGTEYFSSKKIHCHNCSTRQRGKDEKEYFHAMLGATLVAPGHDKVIPLEPEFIAPQDGAEKQDCENAAAKRWLRAHGAHYARLNPIYLGDDLFSRDDVVVPGSDQGCPEHRVEILLVVLAALPRRAIVTTDFLGAEILGPVQDGEDRHERPERVEYWLTV